MYFVFVDGKKKEKTDTYRSTEPENVRYASDIFLPSETLLQFFLPLAAASSMSSTVSSLNSLVIKSKTHFLNSPRYVFPNEYSFKRNSITYSVPSSSRKLSICNFQVQNGTPLTPINNSTPSNKDQVYRRIDSCLVVPPPRGQKPIAVIKFLGGAFIGAVPEVTYSYLIQQLAAAGYLIIAVPYNVTFDHERVTSEIYRRFHACFDLILASGLPDYGLSASEFQDLPLYSVGHSNGALLQVLTGSYFCEKIPKANAIISYNNRPASEAVPYFEQLGPLVSQTIPLLEAFPMYTVARNASEEVWKVLYDTAQTIVPGYDPEAAVSVSNFVNQLPAVFNQLAEGISEFKPTPNENLDCFKNSYNIKHTLLVKFDSDTIDETDLLEATLRPRVDSYSGKLEKVILSGNHITPCIQEPRWQVGDIYTPGDAVAQRLKALALNETRVLSQTIADWFKQFE